MEFNQNKKARKKTLKRTLIFTLVISLFIITVGYILLYGFVFGEININYIVPIFREIVKIFVITYIFILLVILISHFFLTTYPETIKIDKKSKTLNFNYKSVNKTVPFDKIKNIKTDEQTGWIFSNSYVIIYEPVNPTYDEKFFGIGAVKLDKGVGEKVTEIIERETGKKFVLK